MGKDMLHCIHICLCRKVRLILDESVLSLRQCRNKKKAGERKRDGLWHPRN